jgi:hypothetical protein
LNELGSLAAAAEEGKHGIWFGVVPIFPSLSPTISMLYNDIHILPATMLSAAQRCYAWVVQSTFHWIQQEHNKYSCLKTTFRDGSPGGGGQRGGFWRVANPVYWQKAVENAKLLESRTASVRYS